MNPKPTLYLFRVANRLFVLIGEWAADGGLVVGSQISEHTLDHMPDVRLGQLMLESLDASRHALSAINYEDAPDWQDELIVAASFKDWQSFAKHVCHASLAVRDGLTYVDPARYTGPPHHSLDYDPTASGLQDPSPESLGAAVRGVLAPATPKEPRA